MSGGFFDYENFILNTIEESLRNLIKLNKVPDDFGDTTNYRKETINILKVTTCELKKLSKKLHLIDLLLSGDTGEDTFLKGLNK